jgi:hypothetical protein
MASIGGPNIVNSGLIFGYDTGQPAFSNNRNTRLYLGRPTSNELSGVGMSTYNNVPGNVSSVLEGLSETFQGAQVIKQTLTAADSSGAYYLSNGNNPGIGVVTSGGGGTGGVYTGHSIFFKPTVPMNGTPIYTNYSNIGGWQSSNLYEAVGDGWFRAYVTWYDTVTRSDGKYWAINPLQAVVNQPIVIYWAGPFREALNSQAVSPYVYSSRSSTGALIDVRRLRTIDLSTTSFSSTNNSMFFDGSDDEINTGITDQLADFSCVVVFKNNNSEAWGRIVDKSYSDGFFISSYFATSGAGYVGAGIIEPNPPHGQAFQYDTSKYNYFAVTRSGNTHTVYLNGSGTSLSKTGSSAALSSTEMAIGAWYGSTSSQRFTGEIPVVKLYNRALTANEIQQDFQAYRLRFGI